ncbi:MAG: GNAT family N-acetyltransferase [Fidelibacterota bacterium]
MESRIIERITSLAQTLATDDIVPASELLSLGQELPTGSPDIVRAFLELAHFRSVNRVFHNSPYQKQWVDLITHLLIASEYHLGICYRQRAQRYANKPLFQWITGQTIQKMTYTQAWSLTKQIAGSIGNHVNPVIGIFTPNSRYGALVDLACLSFAFRVIPIPTTLSQEHFQYILHHAGITHLFLGGTEQITLVEQISKSISLPQVILFPGAKSEMFEATSWETFLANGKTAPEPSHSRLDMNGIASIMYTSGTTADPKGIIFSQTNIMSKRFFRPLALPEISSRDTFLAYLPLYHTFGRFLEMMGSLYLGSTYTFAESPGFQSLLKDFRLVKPTVFISIPKRWIQLYDYVQDSLVSGNGVPARKTIKRLTGGQLKWGLSAAGHLDPGIFQYFQSQGIQLLSGYGMTEATGGILMTPPGDYVNESVGKPLPGIETRLNDDGELLLRGCYVTSGYYPESPQGVFKDGWFYTGDIFRIKRGHYFIIDRKKEIYKNSRGQTISPQKIENMFLDFDSVKSVFLVGDGQEYNTLLIYPDMKNIPEEQKTDLQKWFTPIVQSVNTFLAPYERIVQYSVIPRDFSREKGELTPKKTFKRKTVLQHFTEYISPMYQRNYISCFFQEYEIRIPNWLMREWGVTRSDIRWDGECLHLNKDDKSLKLTYQKTSATVGSFLYQLNYPVIDLDAFLKRPDLWLGNEDLILFTGNVAFRKNKDKPDCHLELDEKALFPDLFHPKTTKDFIRFVQEKSVTLSSVHQAAMMFHHQDRSIVIQALSHLDFVLAQSEEFKEIILRIIKRLCHYPDDEIQFQALNSLLPYLSGEEFITLLLPVLAFAQKHGASDNADLDISRFHKGHFKAVMHHLQNQKHSLASLSSGDYHCIAVLLGIVAAYCSHHPSTYLEGRRELNWWRRFCPDPATARLAEEQLQSMIQAFRLWLGATVQVTIDPETDQEYGWQDVIEFDDNVSEAMRPHLTKGLSETSLLRESIFIFAHNKLIQLNDIPLKGIWVSKLGEAHGKLVYRVLVQTRYHESFNLVINYNQSLPKEFLEEEIQWLIVMSSREGGRKLVEDFGGYWPEHQCYTEEYIPGETLSQYLERNRQEINGGKRVDRWQMRWLHFIWNGCMAYFDFWYRTNYSYIIADPSPANLIIPEYDYTSGTRLISISNRVQNNNFAPLLFSLWENFILKTEAQYRGLQRMADWEILFTALIQVVSVKNGLELLRQLQRDIRQPDLQEKCTAYDLTPQRIDDFITEIVSYGVLTKQVTFAALRYNRWLELNPKATKEARGSILLELYKDYQLRDLLEHYPETRIRFFLMTCFKDSPPEFRDILTHLQKDVRARAISLQEMDQNIRMILEKMDINDEDEYFLTRLLFEHIQAQDFGKLVSWDFGQQGRLDLITTITDDTGEYYRIRSAFHPREIAGFYAILSQANMAAPFHQDHQFLLMLDAQNHVIGGIYWKDIGNSTAYLERIVIRREFQKRGLSARLLNEFFQRLTHLNYQYVTVGFFQAGLFYKHGFTINKQFGGLVKILTPE